MTKSSKQKRVEIKISRARKKAKQEREELLNGLKQGTIIPVDESKVFSRSVPPSLYWLKPILTFRY